MLGTQGSAVVQELLVVLDDVLGEDRDVALPSSRPRRTRRASSPGTSTSTPLSAGPTNMPPERRKGDLQKEPPGGIFAESADHGLGRSRGGLTSKIHLAVEQGQKPLVRRDHGRAAGRLPAVRAGPGGHPGSEAGARQAAQAPGPGPGRQGVRRARQSLLPAQTRDQGHHPGTGGPGPQPPQALIAWRAAAAVRQGRLQAAARGRVHGGRAAGVAGWPRGVGARCARRRRRATGRWRSSPGRHAAASRGWSDRPRRPPSGGAARPRGPGRRIRSCGSGARRSTKWIAYAKYGRSSACPGGEGRLAFRVNPGAMP